jgi:hypothetical protein
MVLNQLCSEIIEAILDDLGERKGILDGIEDYVMNEIREDLKKIILKELANVVLIQEKE